MIPSGNGPHISLLVCDINSMKGFCLALTILALGLIAKNDHSPDYSVDDVLFAYSKAYAVTVESGTIDYEVPAKLEKLDKGLNLNIFPILRS